MQYDRQMEKEKTVQLTEELDQQWKNLHNLVEASKKGKVLSPDLILCVCVQHHNSKVDSVVLNMIENKLHY